MSRMLINVQDAEECRIAVIGPNSTLEEYHIQSKSVGSIVGNVYKGIVTNVEPGLQAAFIDIGLGKNGFLHVSDVFVDRAPNGGGNQAPSTPQTPSSSPAALAAPSAPAAPVAEGTAPLKNPEAVENRSPNENRSSNDNRNQGDSRSRNSRTSRGRGRRGRGGQDRRGPEAGNAAGVNTGGEEPFGPRPDEIPGADDLPHPVNRAPVPPPARPTQPGSAAPREWNQIGGSSSELRDPLAKVTSALPTGTPPPNASSPQDRPRERPGYRSAGYGYRSGNAQPSSQPGQSGTPGNVASGNSQDRRDNVGNSGNTQAPQGNSSSPNYQGQNPRQGQPSGQDRRGYNPRHHSNYRQRPPQSPAQGGTPSSDANRPQTPPPVSPDAKSSERPENPKPGGHKPSAGMTLNAPPSWPYNPPGTTHPGEDEESRVLRHMGRVADDIADADLDAPSAPSSYFRKGPIQAHLRKGQEILVQVTKDGIGNKGPALTTYISLPGRHLVLMPQIQKRGVSRKVENRAERDRLRQFIASAKIPGSLGVIARTAAIGQTKVDLQKDLRMMLRLWEQIGKDFKKSRAPAMIYSEATPVISALRDLMTPEVVEIQVDSEKEYQEAREYMKLIQPKEVDRVKLYPGPDPLFHHFKIETELEKLYERRVSLPCGGTIVIDQTEALLAIDVNSARLRDTANPEETAFRVNKEAAEEIARQLKLRDLGGVIVIDFIDMQQEKHVREVEKTLATSLKNDKARLDIGKIGKFGILTMTRQRHGLGIKTQNFVKCSHCGGSGLIKSVEGQAIALLRNLYKHLATPGVRNIEVICSPEVASYLLNRRKEVLGQIEANRDCEVAFTINDTLPPDSTEFKIGKNIEKKH